MQPRRAGPDELEQVNAIYTSIRFAPAAPEDEVWTIGERRALGRLVVHPDGALELGGIWVHPDDRGLGHARVIVEHLVRRLDRPCWCLPFAKLDAFYREFGFLPTDRTLPASIAARLLGCGRTYDEVVVARLRP